MNPARVNRRQLDRLTDLPNIGPAMAADFRRLGFNHPGELAGCDPYALYDRLCALDGRRHDPCVIDVFLSVTRFLAGDPPRVWWAYTAERQRTLAAPDRALREPPP